MPNISPLQSKFRLSEQEAKKHQLEWTEQCSTASTEWNGIVGDSVDQLVEAKADRDVIEDTKSSTS